MLEDPPRLYFEMFTNSYLIQTENGNHFSEYTAACELQRSGPVGIPLYWITVLLIQMKYFWTTIPTSVYQFPIDYGKGSFPTWFPLGSLLHCLLLITLVMNFWEASAKLSHIGTGSAFAHLSLCLFSHLLPLRNMFCGSVGPNEAENRTQLRAQYTFWIREAVVGPDIHDQNIWWLLF